MTVSVYVTRAATALAPEEMREIARLAGTYGRATLLVDSVRSGEVCRRCLADAGIGTDVDVLVPAAWLAGLWELHGDGRQLVDDTARRLLMAAVLADAEASGAEALAPLKNNPGSVGMLVEMARAYMPAVHVAGRDRHALSRAEMRSDEMLARYHERLARCGLVEPADAACILTRQFEEGVPAALRAVVVRGVPRLPEHLLLMLGTVAGAGELACLYNARQRPMADALSARFGCPVAALPGDAGDGLGPAPRFAEVCGPTARLASYARLVAEAATDGSVAVAAPDPLGLFRDLAARLAARGLAAQVDAAVRFPDTRAGQAFFQLIDVVERMNHQEVSAWWPAPEMADWLRSPFSGVGPQARYSAVALDTQLRRNRTLTKEGLFAQLDSLQSRERNRERERAERQGCPPHEVVLKDVVDAIDTGHYPRALRLMYEAARSLGQLAFGAEGFAACQAELAALQAALDVFERARALDVPGAAALLALRNLATRTMLVSAPDVADAEGAGGAAAQRASDTDEADVGPRVHFMRLGELAACAPGSFDAVLWLDADAASYPLAERETVSSKFLAKVGCPGLHLPAAAHQRDCVDRARRAASHGSWLAYVSHDGQAEERFPALAYAEARAAAGSSADMVAGLPGEGALFSNLDAAEGEGAQVDDRPRCAEHVLPEELTPFVLLDTRCINGRPVTRTLSASQIENYLACPYRWFVNSRVATRRLDVEFGPIERGNFSHDVMQRFYERLGACGLARVAPDTIDRCLEEMDAAFDEVREDHLRGRYTHGKYAEEERPRAIRNGLVPLDRLECGQIDAMRARFHEVVRHDATMLPLYVPRNLEYSFDREGVVYAGRPLGGRIDRVDVAPDAGSGERLAVIDYKTGANVDAMRLQDPTIALDDGGELDPWWLPGRDADRAPKVQTLMYATALERAGGGSAQAAVYYGLRGPVIAGAASSALTESEPPQIASSKVGAFPGTGGTKKERRYGSMDFPALLEQVEHAISREFDQLEAGEIAPRPASDSCAFCPLTMCEKRR